MVAKVRLPNRILEYLYDRRGEFVSPQELAAGGLAPAALQQALEQLGARGHRFERSAGRGVRLLRPTALDAHLIERDLPVRQIGRHVLCFDGVASTNDVAFDSAAKAGGQSLTVTAEHQTAGRGRLGRRWQSRPGTGILASVLLHEAGRKLPQEALTIAAGLAVAEGIEHATGVAAAVEWPNDVVVRPAGLAGADRSSPSPCKLAGAMVEIRGGSRRRQVVVGFGINVTAAPPAGELARPAACLADVVDDASALERIGILRAVLVRLDHWAAAGRTEQLHQSWLRRCEMINTRQTVASAGRRVTGRMLDVSPLSGLILLTDSGEQVHLPAATSTIVR